MRTSIRATLAAALAAVIAALALAPAAALAASASPGKTASHSAGTPPPTPPTPPPPAPPARQCMKRSATVRPAIPWAQQQFQPGRVWDFTQGAGQVVAVLDSGVSATAPMLAGAVLPGRSALTGGPANTDCTGHGTFAAGIIAARPTPGIGFAGLAPGARILPVNVTRANGSVPSQAVAAGLMFAVDNGATVVDVSTDVTPGPSAALAYAVAYATARNVVVVAPVGATQNSVNQVSYPASYPGVVGVTAVDSTAAPTTAPAARVSPDLAAPGSQVTSIGPRGPGLLTGSGPSVATAFVAATAALVRSYHPSLSAAQVVARLEATADQPGTPLPDPQMGYGIIDPYTAVTTVLPAESGGHAPQVPVPPPPRLPRPARVDPWPTTAALIVGVTVAVGIAVAIGAAPVVRHGRRRGWSPALRR